jgi:predicted transcriptional regulator of viral defense system
LILLEAGPEAQWAEHEYLIATTLVEPYYLAYATALSYYGYSERQPNPVWITTTRRKRPTTIEGLTYRLVITERAQVIGLHHRTVQTAITCIGET